MGDRYELGFIVGIEIDVIIVWAVDLDFVLCDLRKRLGFIAWMEIHLVLVWGSILTWFSCPAENNLVLVLSLIHI